jgi:hypothetical protein
MRGQVTIAPAAQTQWAKRFLRIATLLQQLSAPAPVVASERLPGEVGDAIAHQAYVAFVQICKGRSDDAGTYDDDEALVRRALRRLDKLESDCAALAAEPVEEGEES